MKYDLNFSKNGISNFFNRIDRINKRLINELKPTKTDIILDIGCDKGILVSCLKNYCPDIIGIDINKEAIENSNMKELITMDARKIEFSDNYFTKIVSSMTIEHIPNLKYVFKEIDRVLKPGGLVILHYPWELFKGMCALRNALIFYKNPFKCCKIHVNKLNHKKIERLIRNTKMKIIKKTFIFDPQPGYITILKKCD